MNSVTHSRPTSIRREARPIVHADEALEESTLSLDDLQHEEVRIQREEDEEVERKRQAAAQLALERGLHRESIEFGFVTEAKAELVKVEDIPDPEQAELDHAENRTLPPDMAAERTQDSGSPSPKPEPTSDEFVPARLPYFR
jgi:hypothetical protein